MAGKRASGDGEGKLVTIRLKQVGVAILAEYMERRGLNQSEALREMVYKGAVSYLGDTAVEGIKARVRATAPEGQD
jgi:hypothetical protein